MKTKNILASVIMLTVAIAAGAQVLHVDSVTVDSAWNTDSSWHDVNGILQQRQSRDCRINFIPQGSGMAQMFIALSIDSGKTWAPSPNPLIINNNALSSTFMTGQKAHITARVLGGDRPGVAFRMTAHQAAPVIVPNPKVKCLGITAALTPGQSVGAALNLSLASAISDSGFSTLAKVYWTTTVTDSTIGVNALSWTWVTTVPSGATGQKRGVIAHAVDNNGLSSAPCTLTVQFLGLQRPMVMKSIAAGTFTMGSSNGLDFGASPSHQVTLSAFTMQETDVTQEQYMAVTGINPSNFQSGDSVLRPVEEVSWYDAVLYCNALSKLSSLDTCYSYTQAGAKDAVCDFTKHGYRLPTEAEWEYARRAGTITGYYWGDASDSATISQYAWYYLNSGNSTQPVATKLPNAWRLYDMSGNVFQWCYDWYNYYTASAATDPTGPASSPEGARVECGGSRYDDDLNYLRSACRGSYAPGVRYGYIGFRCVLR